MSDLETSVRTDTSKVDREVENIIERVWGKEGGKYIMDIDTVPETDWIVEGIVVRQGLTLIYGESQMGKTTFSLHLIDAIQTGSQFFGRACKKGKVILAEQDQSPPILRKQKEKLGKPKKLWAVKIPLKWDNREKKFNEDLPNMLRDCQPDVVFIDAYTSLGIEDINHPSAGLTFDELRRYSQGFNCAFVLIHHTGKSGVQMGSNLNIAKMDSVIELGHSARHPVETTDYRIKNIVAHQEKLKADGCEDIELTFNTSTLQMTLWLPEKSCRQKVIEYKQKGKPLEEIKELLPDEKPDTIRKYYQAS
jgi:hypothetical protein